ncbi:MAG: YdcF family protein [Gammaproteobacteria bacterium]|nr:MAG: YdcF family protein [Gammaproteobacteria bacterium]
MTLGYVLKTLLLPPGLFWLVLLAGLWLQRRRRAMGTALLLALLIAGWLLSLPGLIRPLAATLERYPPLSPREVPADAGAIVVLAGGLRRSGDGYDLKTTTLDRLREGARLHRETGLPLLLSGGKVFGGEGPAEAELMQRVLGEEFNLQARWLEQESRNTAENARYSAAILGREGIGKVVLVTHALHMPRAVEQFRRAGLEVVAAPIAFISTPPAAPSLFDWLPSLHALNVFSAVLHEYLGLAWYRLRYR